MKKSMKTCVHKKKFDELCDPSMIDDGIKPDISARVEEVSSRFNSYILYINNRLLQIKNQAFASEMLSSEGEEALIAFLERAEEYLIANRKQFEEFKKEYTQLIKVGCKISQYASSHMSNADTATSDAVRNFDFLRADVMNHFYDSLPEDVRLGDSPIFGKQGSPEISKYIDSILS